MAGPEADPRLRARRRAAASVQKHLAGKGEGEASLILLLEEGREVEMRLPGRYAVTPQIASALAR